MRVGKNYFPKSSFLSTDKDLSLVIKKIMENQKLLKMLYYTQKDCLQAPDLNSSQIYEMINKQIKIIPQIKIDEECPIYLIVSLDNYTPNFTNPEFRDCTIQFDILCSPDHWNLGNFQLRPYKIAGELDALFDGQKLTGIGEVQFLGGKRLLLNSDLMGFTLIYSAVHGVEDKINPLS